MDLERFFDSVEDTMLARYQQAEAIRHAGDRGQNRESDLREFLRTHLPSRYGVTKGEVVTKDGGHSHSADVVIYDAMNCPVLYSGKTAVLPVEGVYGIIEVKSTLSKSTSFSTRPARSRPSSAWPHATCRSSARAST